MDRLPTEITVMLFENLRLDQRANLRLVNKKFKESIEFGLKKIDHIHIGQSKPLHLSSKYIGCRMKRKSYRKRFWPKFYSFLNKYCSESLHLSSDFNLEMIELVMIAPKLKSLVCPTIVDDDLIFPHQGEKYAQVLYEKFDQLIYLRLTSHGTCADLFSAERIKRRQPVLHLTFPFEGPSGYLTSEELIPRSVKSIALKNDVMKPHMIPKISADIASSLTEFEFIGDFEYKKLPGPLNSLELLKLKSVNTKLINNSARFFKKFYKSSDSLNHLHLSLDEKIYPLRKIINNFLDSLDNLKTITLDFELSDHVSWKYSSTACRPLELSLNSTQLTKLDISTNFNSVFKISSTKITDLQINCSRYMDIDLEMDPSSLLVLEIRKTRITNALLSFIQRAVNLKTLVFEQCPFESKPFQHFSLCCIDNSFREKATIHAPTGQYQLISPTGPSKPLPNFYNIPYVHSAVFNCNSDIYKLKIN